MPKDKRHYNSFPCFDALLSSAVQILYYSLSFGTLISVSVQTLHSVIAGCNTTLLTWAVTVICTRLGIQLVNHTAEQQVEITLCFRDIKKTHKQVFRKRVAFFFFLKKKETWRSWESWDRFLSKHCDEKIVIITAGWKSNSAYHWDEEKTDLLN